MLPVTLGFARRHDCQSWPYARSRTESMELGLSRSGTSSAMLISMTDTPGPSTEDASTENEPTELSLMLERFQSNHSRES